MSNIHHLTPPIGGIAELQPGDRIEARHNGITHYFGRIDHVVPEHGAVWLIEGVGGTRTLLYQDEYDLHLTTR